MGVNRPFGFNLWRLRWYIAGLLATFMLLVGHGSQSGAMESLIEARESKYNNIYVHRRGPIISMTFGHNRRFYTESMYDTRDELVLPVKYTRYMTVALAYAQKLKSALEIGFGGGRTAWYLHKSMPELKITSVELDAVVFELAKKYFGINADRNFNVEVADGRRYLRKSKELWDLVMIDAYRGPFVPFHLLTIEFFQQVKRHVSPGGVVVQNVEPTTMMFESAIKTIGSVFDHVDLFDAGGNVVVVAYDGQRKSKAELLRNGQTVSRRFGLRYNLAPMIEKRRIVTTMPSTGALTDDFAPVESLLAIERNNRKLDVFSKKQ